MQGSTTSTGGCLPCPDRRTTADRQSALVPRRGHLPGPRPRILRQQRRRHRRLPRADAEARLHPVARRHGHLAAAVLPVAAPRRRLRHRALRRRPSELRHATGLPGVPERRARSRASRHHGARDQPHVRSASVVPGGAPRAHGARRSATSTSGATPIRSTRACRSSSRTPSDRTGRGIRSPASTSGTASSTISRI